MSDMKETIRREFEEWSKNEEYSDGELEMKSYFSKWYAAPPAFYAGFMARDRIAKEEANG